MAISTANTLLKFATTKAGSYSKLTDIIGYPDMGSAPSKLDTTDLTQTAMKTSIFGLQEAPDLTFEANYDETIYNTIVGMAGTVYWYHLEFGSTEGVFEWSGQVSIFATGGAVDEVRKMTIVISCETAIEFSV